MQTSTWACGRRATSGDRGAAGDARGRVTAIDLSPDMVAVTRRKAERLGSATSSAGMDVQSLTFKDDVFDAATCRFG